MLRELETLSVTWRGDGLEVRVLQMLARIYSDPNATANRSGNTDRDALAAQFRISRQGQDAAAACSRPAFSQSEGRRSSTGRCARDVLRVP